MTLEEAIKQGFRTRVFTNGDWAYRDPNGNWHLFRYGVELTEGVVAKDCWSYPNSDWDYKDAKGNYHLFRDGVELTEGVEAKYCYSYLSGDWEHTDTDGNNIMEEKNGK